MTELVYYNPEHNLIGVLRNSYVFPKDVCIEYNIPFESEEDTQFLGQFGSNWKKELKKYGWVRIGKL